MILPFGMNYKRPRNSNKNFPHWRLFVYATFDYHGKHARVTLGDMYQQINNNYQDGYSNIIIHPDGKVKTNWK